MNVHSNCISHHFTHETTVWISSVTRVSNPHQPTQISDSYGTLSKTSILQSAWDSVLNTIFPNASDREDVIAPNFGLGQTQFEHTLQYDYNNWNTSSCSGGPIPEKGKQSVSVLLVAINQVLGIEYCPMLPDILCILLTHMPEAYAYTTMREIVNTCYYLPVCLKDYYSWCKSFEVFAKRMSKDYWKFLSNIEVLTPEGLEPIFKRFFTTLLKREDVLHFMDIYLVDGSKAIYRLGLSFMKLVPKSKLKVSSDVHVLIVHITSVSSVDM